MVDLVGYFANIFYVLGVILLAHKNKLGFVCCFIANSSYIVVGILSNLSSIIVISVILDILNVYSYIKWAKEEKFKIYGGK